MVAVGLRSLVRRWAGVLAALLAGFLLAPAAARASCGDYVVFGGHATRAGAAMPSHAPAVADPHATPRPARDPHRPCSGPNCSRSSLPLPVVPPLPPVTTDTWGCLPAALHLADPGPCQRLSAGPGPLPVFRTSSIYHPPRTSSAGSCKSGYASDMPC